MKKYNILLVEDNQGDVLLTKEAFEESGDLHSFPTRRSSDLF